MAELSATRMKQKAQKPKPPASKTTASYWQQKVFREKKFDASDESVSDFANGAEPDKQPTWVSAKFYVRMQVGDERRKFSLKASVAEEAGKEAAALYREILSNGWPDKKTKGGKSTTARSVDERNTIGGWIEAATAKASVREDTAKKYSESLRTIVGDIMSLSRARKPEDRRKIDQFPVDGLTREVLNAWIEKRVDAAGKDVVKAKRARNTVRALIANAKALFTPPLQEAMGIKEEKHKLPFRGLKLPPRSTTRYTSKFDAHLLLEQAASDLGGAKFVGKDPGRFEMWKILYLAIVAGLRYREIDNLRKEDVSPSTRRISIRAHGEYEPKTHASEADITVSENAAKLLESMIKKTKGVWFVTEARSNRSPAYRTGAHHDAIVTWLRNYEERGVKPLADVHKPLHELRKEAGTLVNSQHGLNEAKNFLRHSSITTTAAYYLGSKGDITTGLS
jgi:integrase